MNILETVLRESKGSKELQLLGASFNAGKIDNSKLSRAQEAFENLSEEEWQKRLDRMPRDVAEFLVQIFEELDIRVGYNT